MKRHEKSGFTVVEVLAIVAVCLAIFFLAIPAISPARPVAQRIKCVNNLKNVGLAFRIFSVDNGEAFPIEMLRTNGVDLSALTAAGYFSLMSNELSTPKILACANDRDCVVTNSFTSLSNRNISYFASITAAWREPSGFLAGDRNLQTNGIPLRATRLLLSPGSQVQFTREMHSNQGNICMTDGSVQEFSNNRLLSWLSAQEPGRGTTNLLLIP